MWGCRSHLYLSLSLYISVVRYFCALVSSYAMFGTWFAIQMWIEIFKDYCIDESARDRARISRLKLPNICLLLVTMNNSNVIRIPAKIDLVCTPLTMDIWRVIQGARKFQNNSHQKYVQAKNVWNERRASTSIILNFWAKSFIYTIFSWHLVKWTSQTKMNLAVACRDGETETKTELYIHSRRAKHIYLSIYVYMMNMNVFVS